MSRDSDVQEPDWVSLPDEELLKYRICDLKLSIKDTELQNAVDDLRSDLEQAQISMRPKIYLGDEWFSPEGLVAIAIPFYLAHPRLKALEQKMMLEVEGGTLKWCKKLLRHEAGHCFDHAYRVSRKKKWREIFGSPKQEYDPDHYFPRRYSRSFVRNLDDWYAQSHPDEDFAETFAVWLDPDRDWRKEYSKWPRALRKLEYVDELVRKYGQAEPYDEKGPLPYSVSRIRSTLGNHYKKRKKENAESYPDFYDKDLRRIFNGEASRPKRTSGAVQYIRKNRKNVVDLVCRWTGSRKYTVNELLKKLTRRCEALDLRVNEDTEQTLLELVAYVSSMVTHYYVTGNFQRSY